MNNNIFEKIPVAINNAYGDPFTESLIDDTILKMEKLKNHKFPYMICTKAVPNQEILSKLKNAPKSTNLFVVYSLTGLDEGNFSFAERVYTIKELVKIFGSVAIMIRPIIKNMNDDERNLERIINVAKESSNILITGALHDKNKRKFTEHRIMDYMINSCERKNIKYFHKSSCAAAYKTNNNCWVHDLGEPQNIDILNTMGMEYHLENNKIVLKKATTGDLNFLRIITKSNVVTENLINNFDVLSFSNSSQMFENTSSWFVWGKNGKCALNCPYCICNQIEYLDYQRNIGVSPYELYKYIKVKPWVEEVYFKDNYKLDGITGYIEYNNIRTQKPCRRWSYE